MGDVWYGGPEVLGQSETLESRGRLLPSEVLARAPQAVCSFENPGGEKVEGRQEGGRQVAWATGLLVHVRSLEFQETTRCVLGLSVLEWVMGVNFSLHVGTDRVLCWSTYCAQLYLLNTAPLDCAWGDCRRQQSSSDEVSAGNGLVGAGFWEFVNPAGSGFWEFVNPAAGFLVSPRKPRCNLIEAYWTNAYSICTRYGAGKKAWSWSRGLFWIRGASACTDWLMFHRVAAAAKTR